MPFRARIVKRPNLGAFLTKQRRKNDVWLARLAEEVARRARKLAPVDTGRLRNSISVARVNANLYFVKAQVRYARFVEFGTRWWAGMPFLRPALISVKKQARRFR